MPDYGSTGFLAAQLVHLMLSGPDGRLSRDTALDDLLGMNRVGGGEREESPVTVLPPIAGARPFLVGHVVAQPRLIEPARQMLLGHLLDFARTEPSADELSAAKTRLANSLALAQLSRNNLARIFNVYEVYGLPSSLAWNTEQDVLAITGGDVVAMAQQWSEQHAIGVVLPGDRE